MLRYVPRHSTRLIHKPVELRVYRMPFAGIAESAYCYLYAT